MSKVFVSMPITGYNLEERKEYAIGMKLQLRSTDIEVVTPFDMEDFEEGKTWDWYMARTIKMLLGCDFIFMCEGWENSAGYRLEREIAEYNNILILGVGSSKGVI